MVLSSSATSVISLWWAVTMSFSPRPVSRILRCTSANFLVSAASVSWMLFTRTAISSSVCRIQNWSMVSRGGLMSSSTISSPLMLAPAGPRLALATQLSRHADRVPRNWWSAARASTVIVLDARKGERHDKKLRINTIASLFIWLVPESLELQRGLAHAHHALDEGGHLPHGLQLRRVLAPEPVHDGLLEAGVGAHGPLEPLVHAGLQLGVAQTQAAQLRLHVVQAVAGGPELGEEVVPGTSHS